mgnify:CR=1 FL=1
MHLKVRKGDELGNLSVRLGDKAKGQTCQICEDKYMLVLASEVIISKSDRGHSYQKYLDDWSVLMTVSRRVIKKPRRMTEAPE